MTGLPSCACGADAAIFDPGQEDERWVPGGFIVRRGRPTVGTCLACWPVANTSVVPRPPLGKHLHKA